MELFNTDKMVRVGEVTRRLALAVVNCELWLWVSKRQNETEAGNEFNLINSNKFIIVGENWIWSKNKAKTLSSAQTTERESSELLWMARTKHMARRSSRLQAGRARTPPSLLNQKHINWLFCTQFTQTK